MTTEAPSNANRGTPTEDTRAKRQRSAGLVTPTSSPESTVTTTPKSTTPIEAVLQGCILPYVETLHPGLQDYVCNLAKEFFLAFATHYWKYKKFKQMSDDSDYIPTSCRVGFKLNVSPELMKGEDYIALDGQCQLLVAETQKKLAAFAIKAHDLNRKNLRKRSIVAFIKALAGVINGFIAKHDIAHLGSHQAFLDVLAYKTDDITSVLTVNIGTLLHSYKETFELAVLPTPSFAHTFERILAAINGPPPGDTNGNQAPAPAPAATATAPPQAVPHAQAPPAAAHAPRAPAAAVATPLPSGMATPAQARNGFATAAALAQAQQGQAGIHQSGAMPPPQARNLNPYLANANNVRFADDGVTPLIYMVPPVADDPSNDTFMSDAAVAPATPRQYPIGARAALYNDTHKFVQMMARGVEVFKSTVKENDEAKRIKSATSPVQLETAADRIAATFAAEGRSATRPVLRGVVRSEADRANETLWRQVQSLQSTVTKMKQQKEQRSNRPQNFQGRSGQAAGRGSSHKQGRGGRGGRGNATTAAARGGNQNRSNGKRAGNGQSSNSKRSN